MIRTRVLSATLSGLMLLVPAGSVFGQTPEPIVRTPEMEERAAALAALFPTTLGGVSIVESLEIDVGQELIGEMDPSDPDDADDLATIDELMTAAGATLDDAATAVSFFQLNEDEYGFMAAYQIRGSDAQQTLPNFIAAFEQDIPDAMVTERQIGGVDVTALQSRDDASTQVLLVPRGDTTWLIAVPEAYIDEAVGSLPEA